MKRLFIISIVLLALFSCKKYEHEDFNIPSCELCDFAKSIEGTYRGLAGGYAVIDNPSVPYWPTDSITLMIEQIFIGESDYIDSTRMHFVTKHWFDYSPTPKYDTIEIIRPDGYVENEAYKNFGGPYTHPHNYYYITPDSIRINCEFYNLDMGGTSMSSFGTVMYRL